MKREHQYPQPFILVRHEDTTGVSGTGRIAEGAIASDGTVAYRWLGQYPSWTTRDSIEHVLAVHGHDGRTTVEYWDWADLPERAPLTRHWVCQVLRSGRHNLACSPDEPHDGWNCGFRWECSLTDAEYRALVQAEGEQSLPLEPGGWRLTRADGTVEQGRGLPFPTLDAGDAFAYRGDMPDLVPPV